MSKVKSPHAAAAPAVSPDDKPDWQPPRHAADGIALAGASQLPANHRLRAEALVAAGKRKDPDGLIPDELIADTAKRLAAEAGETEQAPPAEAPAAAEGE